MTHLPPEKWRLRCSATSIHATDFYRPRIPSSQSAKQNLELVELFARKLTIRVFHFTWKSKKGSKCFWWKNKHVLSPAHRIESLSEHCDYLQPFARYVDISRYSHLKMCDLENLGQGHDVQHSQWRHSIKTTWLPIGWQ